MDEQIQRVIAPYLGAAQRVVDCQREVGQRPAIHRCVRRLGPQFIPAGPQPPDTKVFHDRRGVIEKQWCVEAAPICGQSTQENNSGRTKGLDVF